MVRSVLTGVLAAAVALALIWRTCAACHEVTQTPANNGCCDQSGKCKTPAPQPLKNSCPTAGHTVGHFAQAAPEVTAETPTAELAVLVPVAPPAPVTQIDTGPSPHDLVVRHASLRI